MDILYLLVPMSLVLLLLIVGIFGWAVHSGQFEILEGEGRRILDDDRVVVDRHQSAGQRRPEESIHSHEQRAARPGGSDA